MFPVGGFAPVNPQPRSARGGAVFFMVVLMFMGSAAGARLRLHAAHIRGVCV